MGMDGRRGGTTDRPGCYRPMPAFLFLTRQPARRGRMPERAKASEPRHPASRHARRAGEICRGKRTPSRRRTHSRKGAGRGRASARGARRKKGARTAGFTARQPPFSPFPALDLHLNVFRFLVKETEAGGRVRRRHGRSPGPGVEANDGARPSLDLCTAP